MRFALVYSLVAAAGCANNAAAQTTFYGLGFLPGTISSEVEHLSGNGNVVVGTCGCCQETGSMSYGFRWTLAGGMEDLGTFPGGPQQTVALGVSPDGSIVVGRGRDDEETVIPFARLSANGLDAIPAPLNSQSSEIIRAVSTEYLIGSAYFNATSTLPYRWRLSDYHSDPIPVLPGVQFAYPTDASYDGSTIVGNSRQDMNSDSRVFLWTLANGPEEIGLPNGARHVGAGAVSGDGRLVVLDAVFPAFVQRSYSWNRESGFSLLPLPPNGTQSTARGANVDGSVIVGEVQLIGPGGFVGRAGLWTRYHGFEDLNEILPLMGIDLSGWNLRQARSVSADGLSIAGDGNHNGMSESWLARLDPIVLCAADFERDFVVNSQDFFAFLAAFFGQSARADLNFDGSVTSQDFFEFLTVFFGGC